ncbi:hypothetical protein ABPG72_007298 [Tetrahymena utriculariae]
MKYLKAAILIDFVIFTTIFAAPKIPSQPVDCYQEGKGCSGCASSPQAQQLFIPTNNKQCQVDNCVQSVIPYPALNGWICNSCQVIKGDFLGYEGQFFDGSGCTKSCLKGTIANKDNGFQCTMIPNPGTAVECSQDSNCVGCGGLPSLFSYVSGKNCLVKDCHNVTPLNNNLSGWACRSCMAATGDQNIKPGQYFNSTACVDSCKDSQYANAATLYTCQQQPLPVSCSLDSSTCAGCGFTVDIQNLFSYVSGKQCTVKYCTASLIGPNINGWVCNSCSNSNGSINIPKGQYFYDGQCVSQCPPDFIANQATGFVCKYMPSPGADVACSKDSSTCGGCGTTNTLQNFFTHGKGNKCSVMDCNLRAIGPNLNGWVCNSCSTTSGLSNINQGQYFDGKTCVTSCPSGMSASVDTEFVCQFPPSRGTDVTCSNDSSTCGGCGTTNDIQNFFTHGKGNKCSVMDCNLRAIGPNLNGWVCNSCYKASGDYKITEGQYFDGGDCVDQCPPDQIASQATGFVCQYPPSPGADVTCSNNSSTCGGCGTTNDIQNLFTHGKGNTCSVTDCNSNIVGSNLNGWVCNSCSQATGNYNIDQGQYYDGQNCVDQCPDGIIANQASGFVCQFDPSPGTGVTCSNDSSTCGGCGTTNAIQKLFTHGQENSCSVTDCNLTIVGSNLNGWVCNSCYYAIGNYKITEGQYFDGTDCVDQCPPDQIANLANGFVCQYPPSPGADVTCSNDSSTCGGCGTTNAIQNLFTHGKGNTCSVIDCNSNIVGSNLNGWVCNSCSQASGNYNIDKGQYYDGTTCVQICPLGKQASAATGFFCQYPSPGIDVACSNDSSTCGGCGITNAIQKLFTRGVGNNCSVTDCKLNVVGSNLNGWVCNSCSQAYGNNNIPQGQYFDGTNCVASCPSGKQASAATGFVCQQIPNPGIDVACSNDSSTCGGCGATNTIQKLFTHGKGNNCSVTDCNLNTVGSSLNGWVCNSCSQTSGNNNIAKGQYYDGKTCVASCPNGQQASVATEFIYQNASAATGFVCQYPPSPGVDVICSNDSSTCGGCGTTNIIQSLFTHGKDSNCSVTDCNQTVIESNLNGWVCNSCNQASGKYNIAKGQYYDFQKCVTNCPTGSSASVATGFVCQYPPSPSTDVICSNDSSTCGGCGTTNTIQNLFTNGKASNCSVTDCNLSVIWSNLNGWVCNSCSQASGNYNIAKGQYYDGTTYVANCHSGQSASAATGFICKTVSTTTPVNNDKTYSCLISYVLMLTIFSILF